MTNNNKGHKPSLRPRGGSDKERWYALARKWCSVFVNRQQNNERCKYCFNMKEYPNRGGYVEAPLHGCDGCAEMEEFRREAEAFFIEIRRSK